MNPTHVKICGLTNLADALVAIEAGADLLGFNLYPKSPRYIAPERIAEIVTEIRGWRAEITPASTPNPQSPIASPPKTVGIFVHESVERILTILAVTGLDYAQLHSDEPPETVAQLAGRAFKALRPTTAAEAQAEAARFAPLGPVDGPRLLIDAFDPSAYGGTGKTADWHTAAALARQYPGLLLAGGLTPENVAAAIRTVQPWGVDVSSGVETAPGQKDHGKIRAFVAAVKNR